MEPGAIAFGFVCQLSVSLPKGGGGVAQLSIFLSCFAFLLLFKRCLFVTPLRQWGRCVQIAKSSAAGAEGMAGVNLSKGECCLL